MIFCDPIFPSIYSSVSSIVLHYKSKYAPAHINAKHIVIEGERWSFIVNSSAVLTVPRAKQTGVAMELSNTYTAMYIL